MSTKPNKRDGYCRVYLRRGGARKGFLVHKLVASAFIPNPDGLPQVDHISKDRSNNHVSNLRWISRSGNNFNTASRGTRVYQYLLDLPEPWVKIHQYGNNFLFDRLYFCGPTDKFWCFVDEQAGFREIIPCFRRGNYHIYCCDISGKQRKVTYGLIKNYAIMELEAKYITGTPLQEDPDDIVWA